MLPYLAAAGHNSYTKSAYLYLQKMTSLHETHPAVFDDFITGHHVVRRSNRAWAGLSSDLTIEQTLMRRTNTTGGLTRGRGITEFQRAKWVLSMPACAEMSRAMQDVTATQRSTSDQHIEIGEVRSAKDASDLIAVTSFLTERNPFSEDSSLRNIATGVVADSDVNVTEAKAMGIKILNSMEGQSAAELSFKKVNQVKTLASKKSSTQNGGKLPTIDPQLLFQRCITASNRISISQKDMFCFELSSHPSALFDSSQFMRQPNKAGLAEELWKTMAEDRLAKIDVSVPNDVQFVLDGGSILHRLRAPWKRGSTFDSILQAYIEFVNEQYPNAVVVFDGYMSGPSTKDMTHLRRSKGKKGLAVHFQAGMKLQTSKEEFLVNVENKDSFIKALGTELERTCRVVFSEGDADLNIAREAVESAKSQITIVIGEDTDILVLLGFFVDQKGHDLYFTSDKTGKGTRRWNMKRFAELFGEARHDLLFLHALTGCDSTSRPFGIGKPAAIRKLLTNSLQRKQSRVFLQQNITPAAIIEAGEKSLVNLYGGKQSETLDELRYRLFCSKVAVGTQCIQIHTLPPTSAAAKHHSLRVYYQVQEWVGASQLDATNFGWKLEKGKLVPITCDLPAAPSELLKIIRCECKGNCDSNRCSCFRLGIKCSPGCENCCGTSCSNTPALDLDLGLPAIDVELHPGANTNPESLEEDLNFE